MCVVTTPGRVKAGGCGPRAPTRARTEGHDLPERHSASIFLPAPRLYQSHPPSAQPLPIRRLCYGYARRRSERDEAAGPQGQNADGAVELRGGDRGRERQRHAQAGADVRHPQAAGFQGDRHHRHRRRRGAAGRFRLPALARRQLPAGAGRHLRVALPDPALCAEDRRHGRGPDPQPQRGRALLRAAQGQQDQLRGPRQAAPQGALRQPHPALSHPVDEAGDRGPHAQGPLAARDRRGVAARQGSARADRGAAAHRQDRAAAEHRPLDREEPPRVLPDRAADRRAARGSDRHAALGEGRGDLLHLRRAGDAPRAGVGDGDREGQAPGRAQARRGDPAGLHHAPRPGLQHGRPQLAARC